MTRRERAASCRRSRNRLRLRRSFELLECRAMLAGDFQNPFDAFDADDNGAVTPRDALIGIGHLKQNGTGFPFPDPPVDPPGQFLDANGDGLHTSQDVLIVIAALRHGSLGTAILPALANDTAPGGTTNDDRITSQSVISGRAHPIVDAIQAQVDGGPMFDIAIDDENNFSFDPNLATDGTDDGEHTVQLVAHDANNNTRPMASVTLTLDTVAPAAPQAVQLTAESDTGPSNTDGVTSDRTPAVVVDGETGNIVRLFLNDVEVDSAVANSPVLLSPGELSDGQYVLHAEVENPAENDNVSSPLTIHVDTVPPSVIAPLPQTVRQSFDSLPISFDEAVGLAGSAFDAAAYTVTVVQFHHRRPDRHTDENGFFTLENGQSTQGRAASRGRGVPTVSATTKSREGSAAAWESFYALNTNLGKPVALKIVRPDRLPATDSLLCYVCGSDQNGGSVSPRYWSKSDHDQQRCEGDLRPRLAGSVHLRPDAVGTTEIVPPCLIEYLPPIGGFSRRSVINRSCASLGPFESFSVRSSDREPGQFIRQRCDN